MGNCITKKDKSSTQMTRSITNDINPENEKPSTETIEASGAETVVEASGAVPNTTINRTDSSEYKKPSSYASAARRPVNEKAKGVLWPQ